MLLALIACSAPSDIQPIDPIGRITGEVVDITGAPISGAEIEVDGILVVSDLSGSFVVDGVTPGDHVVSFEAEGFASGYKRASLISWETVTVGVTLADVGGTVQFDATEGGLFVVDGVEIDISNLHYADGSTYSGMVTMDLTYLDPYSADMKYAPGDLGALSWDDSFGKDDEPTSPSQLVSNGMFNLELDDEDGEELEADISVSMPVSNGQLPDSYQLSEGDSVPLWIFDEAKGLWIESGAGTVVWSDADQLLLFEFDAANTPGAWYNCDQPIQWTCYSGIVRDVLGFPIRGALVQAQGGWTASESYTDENGYFEVRVAVGDTVSFSAHTAVGGKLWSTNWSEYISGEGSCEEPDNHDIPVCREAGIVMADNLELNISGIDAGDDGDQLRAWFWEPPGDPTRCQDFWQEIPLDSCVSTSPEDYPDSFKTRTVGIAYETRSAGPWVDVKTPRDTYRMDADTINDNPVYLWETLDIQNKELVRSPVDLRAGDVLRGSTPGNAQAYFGPIKNETWMTIPKAIDIDNVSGALGSRSRSSSLHLGFDSGNNDYLLAFVTTDSNTDGLMCRIKDDGSLDIPAADLQTLPAGFASISIYRPQIDWAEGPDGLPIRLQALSGEIVEVELK